MLTPCPECQHQVSDRAIDSPGCGAPFNQRAQHVTLTDVDLPISSLLKLMFSWSIAAIPVVLVWWLIIWLLMAAFASRPPT